MLPRAALLISPVDMARVDGREGGRNLQPQALLITLLGDYLLARGEPVWSGGIVRMLETFGFTPASARLSLSRLSRKGLLRRSKDGRLTYYELSDAGLRLLEEGKQRIFSFGAEDEWEGTWTVVSYSIPEERRATRTRLRNRLAFLGFASLHDGTWYSPRDHEADVDALLDELEVRDLAQIFLGRPSGREDVGALVMRGWDLDRLAAEYAAFIGEFREYTKRTVRRRITDETAFVTRTLVMHEFRRFPSMDPELPESIVGGRWQRSEAVRTFHDVHDGLADAATRHFEALVALN